MTTIVPPCVFCKRFPCDLQREFRYPFVNFCSAVEPIINISKESFIEIIRYVNDIGLEKFIELYNKRIKTFSRFFDEAFPLKEQKIRRGVQK